MTDVKVPETAEEAFREFDNLACHSIYEKFIKRASVLAWQWLSAARAEPKLRPVSDMQPIETAPVGEHVLLWEDRAGFFVGLIKEKPKRVPGAPSCWASLPPSPKPRTLADEARELGDAIKPRVFGGGGGGGGPSVITISADDYEALIERQRKTESLRQRIIAESVTHD